MRWLLLLGLVWAVPAWAQQTVHVPVEEGGRTLKLASQLYRPSDHAKAAAAIAIFHGCGGPGQNTARMAALLQRWGYVALGVDSFSARGLKDVCGARHWPTQADAERRAHDIDAAIKWLRAQSFVDPARIAFMGYSYGGGVAMLRALTPRLDDALPPARAAILVYPDCALADALGPRLRVRQPTLFALAALDDWTPVSQCQAVIDRVAVGRDLIETRVYDGAYHSFDALGLPVRYLADAGNRSKPGGCCGAHYGANEAAWKAFVTDVRAFLTKQLGQ
ncbi:Dienelactone hydrolase [Enhydrobacter aerosaccus]|uniref:Dienelactone hydrolase n=1 Tax=Enhydrobacter aerosaccus TaxID=225324 RepID=A0A1T4MT03_9HYPH|nr:dienelactone hydrolase family protein [Enhydrobacter aerosaccus]SJZ69944.1 Dienelactone hydrolase [Enhydrobacter aerosaccus]